MTTKRSATERIRCGVKAAVERILVASGAAAVARRRLRNGAFIVAYHNVIPDGAAPPADVSLHVTRTRFAAQLDVLMETHDVMRLDAALAVPDRRVHRGRPVAAITFDDAYRGALTLGMEEVRARGLEATTFVAPAFVGDKAFWWDQVDWPADSDEGDRFRARALTECGGRDLAVRELALRLGYDTVDVPSYARCVTDSELHDAAAKGGLSLGAHTWSHANLAMLDPDSVSIELARPLAWLRERFTAVVPWLAYPYGLWSPGVVAAARAAGYSLALRVDGGWIRERSGPVDPFTLPRFNVPAGLSPNGFMLRASGMFCQ